jgi:hypothetical protein
MRSVSQSVSQSVRWIFVWLIVALDSGLVVLPISFCCCIVYLFPSLSPSLSISLAISLPIYLLFFCFSSSVCRKLLELLSCQSYKHYSQFDIVRLGPLGCTPSRYLPGSRECCTHTFEQWHRYRYPHCGESVILRVECTVDIGQEIRCYLLDQA